MNTLTKDLVSNLEKLYSFTFSDGTWNEDVTIKDATSIDFACELNENGDPESFILKNVKLPKKKKIDLAWFIDKLSSDNIYQNFSKNFKKILDKKYPNNFNVYPTSYGIGVFKVFRSKNAHEEIAMIKEELDLIGIKYKTELSTANWVFRFKISKSKENLNKIK